MMRIHDYLVLTLLAFSLLLSPLCFSKEKSTVSPKLYKKLLKAEKLIANKNYSSAQQSLKALLSSVNKGSLEEATILRNLASVYALQGNYKRASDTLAKAIKSNKLAKNQQGPALLNLGQLYMATDQYSKAIRTLESWLAKNGKGDSQFYIMLAKAHAQLNQYRKAIPYVEKAIRKSKKPADSWYQLQLALYLETKNYSKAAGSLERLIRLKPDHKPYWMQLTSVYQHAKQYSKAATIKHLAYEKGILASEQEILDVVNLFLYIDAPYKAATILTQEMQNKRISYNSRNWEKLANAWTQAREFNKALSALETASRMNSKGQLYQRMGNIYIGQQKWSQAATALNKALQKGGLKNTGNTYLLLGISYYEQKKLEQARKNFNRATNHKSSSKAARQWLNFINN